MGENQTIFFKQKNLWGTDSNKSRKIQGSHEYSTKYNYEYFNFTTQILKLVNIISQSKNVCHHISSDSLKTAQLVHFSDD